MTVSISCKIDRIFIFSDDRRRDTSIVTSHDSRMTKAVKNISIIVEDLDRCDRYKIIYRTLDVAEHKKFCHSEDFMKEATSRFIKK